MRQKNRTSDKDKPTFVYYRCKKLIYPANEVVGGALFQVIKCVEQGAYNCNIHFTY